MKNKTILICATLLLSFLCATAQNPFKNLTENVVTTEVTYKGQSPTIEDFLTCFLSETEDEIHDALSQAWDNYLRKDEPQRGTSFTVDLKNGFARYDMDYDAAYPDDPNGIKSYVEFCYWNCDDGKHKLFAQNIGMTQDGKATIGQYDGLYIYAYDNATKTLYMIDQNLIGLVDDLHDFRQGPITFALPRKGKDIDVFVNTDTKVIQKKLTWNGKGFTYSK